MTLGQEMVSEEDRNQQQATVQRRSTIDASRGGTHGSVLVACSLQCAAARDLDSLMTIPDANDRTNAERLQAGGEYQVLRAIRAALAHGS